MNGLQIYEISKQAQFESQRDAEIDRLWHQHTLNTPRRSAVGMLGSLLRRMLVTLRVKPAEPAAR